MKHLLKKLTHTSENSRIVLANATGTLAVKGAALVVSLLTLPAYLRYFENQIVLGLWFTIVAVLVWTLNFDFGIGNGLRNLLAAALTKNDQGEAKRLISSSYFFYGLIVAAISIIFMLSYQHIDWRTFFNIESNAISEKTLRMSVLIVFIGILVQFFLRIVGSVLYAMQKSALNNLLALISSTSIFLYVAFAKPANLEAGLITLSVVYGISICFPLLVSTIVVFAGPLRAYSPSIKSVSMLEGKKVLLLGASFFFVQLAYMLIMNTNEFLITLFSRTSEVVEYQIYFKLFSLISVIFVIGMTPVWSAITKAIAEHNLAWVRMLYKRLWRLSVIVCIGEFGLILVLQPVINLWLQDEAIKVNYLYALLFALFGCLMILNSLLSSFANGAGELRIQAICFGIGVILKIPLAWLLVTMLDSWIGVVLANIAAIGIYCMIQPFWLKKYFREIEEKGTINVQE